MTKNNSISFIVHETNPPLEIQLEPEAFTFIAYPNEELTFAVVNPTHDFSWAIRHKKNRIQLFPETYGDYEKIELYRNGKQTDELEFLFKNLQEPSSLLKT
ncbi:hypothetical protein [Aureibacter tunicatorum]|uniref:Uncharacterized protein n=1 Tax=Aureibacter tunicatorum TaxID=866807 RepID=A0AAE4BRE3_9BACT|nr:hypothetical protein [Aureibacter tunicatorum]MDR6238571.1 hypothetical protein [Aureibacter tunicatorum]BDD05498.1 hypothetical protein AUTU_29810 [Aureibacter tunicatorum]